MDHLETAKELAKGLIDSLLCNADLVTALQATATAEEAIRIAMSGDSSPAIPIHEALKKVARASRLAALRECEAISRGIGKDGEFVMPLGPANIARRIRALIAAEERKEEHERT